MKVAAGKRVLPELKKGGSMKRREVCVRGGIHSWIGVCIGNCSSCNVVEKWLYYCRDFFFGSSLAMYRTNIKFPTLPP